MGIKYEGFSKEFLDTLYNNRYNDNYSNDSSLTEQILNKPKQRFDDPYSDAVKDSFKKYEQDPSKLHEELKQFENKLGLKHTESKLPLEEPDQKAKADAGKPRVSLVPSQIIYDIARIREYGNKKYPEGGKDNWKRVEIERYRDAAYRHLLAYIDDPHGVDEESGLPHLWHLACNVAFLCELEQDKYRLNKKLNEKATEEDISYMD